MPSGTAACIFIKKRRREIEVELELDCELQN